MNTIKKLIEENAQKMFIQAVILVEGAYNPKKYHHKIYNTTIKQDNGKVTYAEISTWQGHLHNAIDLVIEPKNEKFVVTIRQTLVNFSSTKDLKNNNVVTFTFAQFELEQFIKMATYNDKVLRAIIEISEYEQQKLNEITNGRSVYLFEENYFTHSGVKISETPLICTVQTLRKALKNVYEYMRNDMIATYENTKHLLNDYDVECYNIQLEDIEFLLEELETNTIYELIERMKSGNMAFVDAENLPTIITEENLISVKNAFPCRFLNTATYKLKIAAVAVAFEDLPYSYEEIEFVANNYDISEIKEGEEYSLVYENFGYPRDIKIIKNDELYTIYVDEGRTGKWVRKRKDLTAKEMFTDLFADMPLVSDSTIEITEDTLPF